MNHDALELRHLRVFLAVVDAGGYTRAASLLGVSQSTVSETVAALERALGTPVVQRQGARTVPTSAGAVLVEHARPLLALAQEAATRTAEAARHDRAPLLVAASESISAYMLPAALATVRATWPELRSEVRTGLCADIRAWVQKGEVELGLVIEPAALRTPRATLLTRTPLILCAQANGRSPRPYELAERPFYLSDASGPYHQALRSCFRRAGASPPEMHASGSIEGVKRALLSSADAIGVLPAFAVARELEAGELAALPMTPPLPVLHVKAILPGGAQARPRPLVDALLAELRSR